MTLVSNQPSFKVRPVDFWATVIYYLTMLLFFFKASWHSYYDSTGLSEFTFFFVATYLYVHTKYGLFTINNYISAFFFYSFFFWWLSFYLLLLFSPYVLSDEIFIMSIVSFFTIVGSYDFLNTFLPRISTEKFKKQTILLRSYYLKRKTYYDLLIYVGLFLSLVFTTLFFVKAGSIPLLASNPEQARVDAMKGSGLIHRFSYLTLHFSTILFAFSQWAAPKKTGYYVQVLIIAFLAFYNMLTGPRSYALYTFLYLFFTTQLVHYGRLKVMKAFLLGVVLLVVVAIIGGVRTTGYANFNYTETMIRFVNRIYMNPVNADRIYRNYQNETISKNSFLIDLEVLLPGTQPDLGTFLKNELGIEFDGGGITVPLPAEGFMNFHFSGVVGYSVFFVLVLKFFEVFLLYNKRYPFLFILSIIFPLQWMGTITMGISGIFVKTIIPTIIIFIFLITLVETLRIMRMSIK